MRRRVAATGLFVLTLLVAAPAAAQVPEVDVPEAGVEVPEAGVPVPEVEVTVPEVGTDLTETPITVPAVDATVLDTPLPLSPPSTSPRPAPADTPTTAPAAPTVAPLAGGTTESVPPVVTPRAAIPSPSPSPAAATSRPPRPSLLRTTRDASAPFAVPLGVMALIGAYLVLRSAFDRRDARLATASVEDRWVGFS